MAWTLNIHHIDVTGSGDATLIIVQEVAPLIGLVPIVRTCLIDGGRMKYANDLHTYLGVALAGAPLDIMISTHYDIDHVQGLTRLLLRPAPRYANTRVYDQGWPTAAAFDNSFIQYVRAINGMNNGGPVPALAAVARVRPTNVVQADGVPTGALPGVLNIGAPAVPGGGAGAINQLPNWLLGTEILWDGVFGGVPAGAPTLTCIAANRFALQVGAPAAGPIGGLGVDPKNEKSLAFVLRFNNFRYYVGGDIEAAQEALIQTYLNNGNNTAGRVLVMKNSHHGANTASARAFISRLRPEAAIISCGSQNQYMHPAQETINILDGYVANPGGVLPVAAHPGQPPAPLYRPVDNYLTGYQVLGPPEQSLGGDVSLTSGDPNGAPLMPGHVVVTVSQLQSTTAVSGRLFIGVSAATDGAAVAAGAGGGAAAAAGAAAAEAAVSDPAPPAGGIAASAARAAATSLGAGGAVAAAAAAQVNTSINGGVAGPGALATAVTGATAGAGGNAVVSAAAGAAAGAAYGGGDNLSIQAAVNAALVAAGVAGGPAGVAAAGAAANAAPAVPGLFDVSYHDLNAMVNPQVLPIV